MSEPYIGEVRIFCGNYAPFQWAKCDGQILAISKNTQLFSLLGTTYGGDGRTTFALPDFRGRIMASAGQGTGLPYYSAGDRFGQEEVTLTAAQIPAHNHPYSGSTSQATTQYPSKGVFANPGPDSVFYEPQKELDNLLELNATSVDRAGGGGSHNNLMPYLVVNYIICLVGTYPPRS